MKKVTKFFMAALLAGMCSLGYAQTTYEWKKTPKPTEIEIGIITYDVDAGPYGSFNSGGSYDYSKNKSEEELYNILLNKAKEKYSDTYPQFVLRNFKSSQTSKRDNNALITDSWVKLYKISATVVIADTEAETKEKLSQALDKALRNVREGSRLAIDQVSVRTGISREDYKDQIIDFLLDKGYKVVAKEYLDKLYEEQQGQQSGIYNDKTTVQENNFSAVGYYINVKVTETSLRVQVVNVSTGEYEGNATVNF